MHIGENIKTCREQMGLNQHDLEEKSGISRTQISRLESGKQNNPQIETIVAISTALGISIEKLVFGTENNKDINYMLKALQELDKEEWEFCNKLIRTVLITSQAKKLGN